jgi:hypothetical protein
MNPVISNMPDKISRRWTMQKISTRSHPAKISGLLPKLVIIVWHLIKYPATNIVKTG